MKNKDLVKLIKGIAKEALTVVEKPTVMDSDSFVEDVLTKRLPNPNLPDTPQRIATDTSQKVAIRFGETIKAYGADAKYLKYIPIAIAAWLMYLDGKDDNGEAFTLSPDPMLSEITKMDKAELLKRGDIFGVDLCETGLGDKILSLYKEMKENTLAKTLSHYMEEYK